MLKAEKAGEENKFSSVGSIIKYYREMNRISVKEVSDKTMIPEKYLIALESNEKDITPSLVHTFSYIKQYASLLGLDGSELVELYKKQINVHESSENNKSEISTKDLGLKESKNNMSEDIVAGLDREIDTDIVIEEKVSKKIEEKDFNEENKNKAKVVSNGNGNGAKSNKPDPTLSELVKNMPTQNQQQALPIKEQPKEEPKNPTISNPVQVRQEPKEVLSAKEQAERILIQAKRDADRMFREAQEYSRQVKYESNKILSDTRKYAEYILTSIEVEFERLLTEVKAGRQILKKAETISNNQVKEVKLEDLKASPPAPTTENDITLEQKAS